MDSCHGRPVDETETIISFNSGAKHPHFKLSNFSACPEGVLHQNIMYPSAEHAFQAYRFPQEMRESLFSVHSDIAELSHKSFAAVGVPMKHTEKKMKYWGKKNMVGILAKMKANRLDGRKLTHLECECAFVDILLAKYSKNEEHRSALLGTGDAFLLEFVRSSVANFKKRGTIERWGGMLEERRICGHNQQGALQMHVRSLIRGGKTSA
mgnify:CR=1 FL=1